MKTTTDSHFRGRDRRGPKHNRYSLQKLQQSQHLRPRLRSEPHKTSYPLKWLLLLHGRKRSPGRLCQYLLNRPDYKRNYLEDVQNASLVTMMKTSQWLLLQSRPNHPYQKTTLCYQSLAAQSQLQSNPTNRYNMKRAPNSSRARMNRNYKWRKSDGSPRSLCRLPIHPLFAEIRRCAS